MTNLELIEIVRASTFGTLYAQYRSIGYESRASKSAMQVADLAADEYAVILEAREKNLTNKFHISPEDNDD